MAETTLSLGSSAAAKLSFVLIYIASPRKNGLSPFSRGIRHKINE